MLQENIKNLRRARGLSQQELADRLHVVRQTVSKWEQGLSVPDAEMLMAMAEYFEVPVDALLGTANEPAEIMPTDQVLAEKLSYLTTELAEQNARRRRLWRWVAVAAVLAALAQLPPLLLWGYSVFDLWNKAAGGASVGIIGGADGPTAIFITGSMIPWARIILLVIFVTLVILALRMSRRKE